MHRGIGAQFEQLPHALPVAVRGRIVQRRVAIQVAVLQQRGGREGGEREESGEGTGAGPREEHYLAGVRVC